VEKETSSAVNRRGLLRRAGAVAAGVGAAGVVAAVDAGPAHVAVGSPVLAGNTVDAANATTAITNDSPTKPTLALENKNGPSLLLTPRAVTIPAGVPQGSFNATTFGELEYQALADTPADVYTSYTATQTWPIKPTRALDTRDPGAGRELILNKGVLDGAGRIKGGSTLLLNLTGLVTDGWAAIGTITVVAPDAGGFLSVFAGGTPRPNTSVINFLPGWVISNQVLTSLGETSPDPADHQSDVIQIYAHVTTHVVFDVTAFIVASRYHIDNGLLPIGAPQTAAAPGTSRADRARAYRPAKR
jgi:hypothetical protein